MSDRLTMGHEDAVKVLTTMAMLCCVTKWIVRAGRSKLLSPEQWHRADEALRVFIAVVEEILPDGSPRLRRGNTLEQTGYGVEEGDSHD